MTGSKYGSGFFINLEEGPVRTVFKTYFVVVMIVTALIGDYCCSTLIKVRLLRGKQVTLVSTVGWIKGLGLFKMIAELRKIPGGPLGWVMLLATLLNLVGEYGVTLTVNDSYQFTTMPFTKGMVITSTNITVDPSPNWEAYRWASTAQRTSRNNAYMSELGYEHYGIFGHVTNDTRFMYNDQDLIGYWDCKRTSPDEGFVFDQAFFSTGLANSDGTEGDDLVRQSLETQGVLYPMTYTQSSRICLLAANDSSKCAGPSSHLVLYSHNKTDPLASEWGMKLAIDTNDLDSNWAKNMSTFACGLHSRDAAQTVKTIASSLQIDNVLDVWGNLIGGSLFPGMRDAGSFPLPQIEGNIQWFLNSIFMVAGANEVATATDPGVTVGALTRSTIVPWWILVMCVVVLLLTLSLACFAICLRIRLVSARSSYDHSHQGEKVSSQEILDNSPIGMLDWMRYAAFTSRDADKCPEVSKLRNWILSTTWHAGRRLGVVYEHEHGHVNTGLTPSGMSSNGQLSYFPSATGYESAAVKGNYAAVNTSEAH